MLNALPLQEEVKKMSNKNRVKGLFEGLLSLSPESSKFCGSTGVLRIILLVFHKEKIL